MQNYTFVNYILRYITYFLLKLYLYYAYFFITNELKSSNRHIMNNKKLLGKRIKELRKTAGLTQEKLAELINIETTSLSGIESGRHFPSMLTLEKIANHLHVELHSLFNFNHLISIETMKADIVKNLDKLENDKIIFIHKFFE